MMRRRQTLAFAGIFLLGIALNLAFNAQSPAYHWEKPEWAPTPVVPEDNPMTTAKIELGRHLFYDKRLSANGKLACAGCHQQRKAFSDGLIVHVGVNGEPGVRNAMTLTNVAYFSSYTWANPNLKTLEKQMLTPLFGTSPIEMGMEGKEEQIFAMIRRDPTYTRLFLAAFPEQNGVVNLSTLTKALACFERSLLSFNSPYDRYKHGEPNAISAAARRGEALFFGERLECYHCHGGINFTDNHTQMGQAFPEVGFHNTGLYNEDGFGAYKDGDSGLRKVTDNEDDEGRFRTASLRNVEVSAPYMHDGSLATLDDVIRKHYAVKGHAAITGKGASPLRSEFIDGFQISDDEIKDLIAFLNSLTDEKFLNNPKFGDPWTKKEKRAQN